MHTKPKSHFLMVHLIILALMVVCSGKNVFAADCNDYADSGERLKCKHGKLLDEHEKTIENLEYSFGGVLPQENFDRLKKANGRAKKAKERISPKGFKSIAKKNTSACDIQEWEGDGDGICEPGEKCMEIIGDGIGDDVQPCKLKGKNKEACEEICADSETPADILESDIDEEFQAELEEAYDDVTGQLVSANNTMESQELMLAEMSVALITAAEPSDSCKASTDWLTYGEVLTMTILKQVSVGVRGITDIAERGCDQTGAGFNCASCCVVAEGLAAAAALTVETADGIFDIIQWGVDSSKQNCLSSLSSDLQLAKGSLNTVASSAAASDAKLQLLMQDVDAIKSEISQLQGMLSNMQSEMENQFNEINNTLATPNGQREGFPNTK